MSHHLRRLKSAARPVLALLIACLLMVVAAAPPAKAGSDTLTGSGNWTAPAGVTSITVECWGGGGGGGSDTSSVNGGGGGGGGGAYAIATYPVVPGNPYTYTVGTAGTGGTIGGTGATAGGESSFHGGSCIAPGGAAGGNGTGAGAGAKGDGGAATGSPAFSGGSGAIGQSSSGGGGGGSAGPGPSGTGAPGNNASGSTAGAALGGTAGTSGAGGAGTSSGTGGSAPAPGPGGGGGGGEYSGGGGGGSRAGGNGFAGKIVITYKQTPSLSITNSPVTYNGSPRAVTLTATAGGTVAGSFSNIRYNGSATVPTNAGTYPIVADFTPSDPNNYNSVTNVAVGDFVINKATPTLSVTNSPVTYNGTQQAATVTGSTAGAASNIKYGGSGTAPTNAGAYAVTADFTPSDTNNFNSLTDAAAGSFVINKATPTLSVTNSPVTYNATQQAATLASSTPGTISNVRYNGSTTVPSTAASYPMTANFVPSDTANYNSLTSASAGTFVINKATPILTVTNSPATYSASAKTATIAVTGPAGTVGGSTTNIRYDNSTTQPINAGTYVVTANFTPSDTTNYNSLANGGAGNFVINQASTTTTVNCGGGPFTYTGAAITPTCTAAATGAGGLNATGLAVTFANNINAGTATASASYGGTANYLPSNGSTTFTINKATPTLSITNSPQVFDGTAKTAAIAASATAGAVNGTYSNILYNSLATSPTDAGSYTVKVDFAPTDATNYNSLTNATAGTFVINKAASATAITCDPGPFAFDGTAQTPCSATVTGPGLSETVAVVYANNTNAGTATANATYAATTNYVSSSDSTTFTIDKATPVLAVTNSPVAYDGTAKTANIVATAAAGTVDGALGNVEYSLSPTAPTNAGTYAVTADFTPVDLTNYNTVSGAEAGNFTIGKAATSTAITCDVGPFTFDGNPQTPCSATVTGPGLSETVAVVYADNTNAGTATANADYAGTANYLASSDSTTFAIDQAATTTTVTCAAGPFTYTGAAIEPCAAGVTGPGGLNQTGLAVTYANNIGAGTAWAGAAYAGTANYLPSGDSTTFPIGKATPVLAVTNSPQLFDGTAKTATVAASGPAGTVAGTFDNIRYNTSSTEPADAGSYGVTADFTPDDLANYSTVSGGSAGSFVIQPAATTTTVTCGAGPFVYSGTAFEPCTAVATGPAGLNLAVAVVYSDNTNAGLAAASANYAGSGNYFPSSDDATFTIAKADPTLSITNSPATYDGTAKAAIVSGSTAGAVSGVKYDGSATEPIGAGSYVVTADFTPIDLANYNTLTGAGAGSFVINKANPTLSITNSPADYDGTPKTANVVGSVAGTASNLTYNASPTAPTNAGTYAITADFEPVDTDNYNTLTGAGAGNFVIQKAGVPTLSVSNSPLVFTGAPQPAVVVGSVPGTPSNILYNGVSTVPTDAGNYVITADFTPDDTVNYETVTGETAGTLVIQQATTTTAVTCGAGPFVYTGAAITPCAANVTGASGLNQNVTVVYAGNVNAGTASASAAFAGDTNHLPSGDAKSFTIDKADPTLSITNSPAAYDGTPKTANVVGSVPGTVSNVRYNGSATAPTNAGTYAVTADFTPTDTANYNTLSSAGAGNFVIEKAGVPTLSVSNSPQVFTGAPQAAVVVGSVAGTVSNIKYNGASSVPSGAGSYVITADFVPNDTVNYDSITGASAGSFTIERAATATAIDCGTGPYTFTGAAITPCAATVAGPGGLSEVVAVSYSSNTNVGTAAANASYAGGSNYLPSNAAGGFTIAKAPATVVVTCAAGPFVYSGSAIEPCTAAVTGPGGLSEVLAVVYANNVNVGTAAASASYAGSANHLPASAAGSFTIGQAATTTVVTCAAGPFTANVAAIEPCTAVVTGPGGLSQALTVVYSNNVNTGTASASASYAGSVNYLASSDTEVFVIGEAVEVTVFLHLPFMAK